MMGTDHRDSEKFKKKFEYMYFFGVKMYYSSALFSMEGIQECIEWRCNVGQDVLVCAQESDGQNKKNKCTSPESNRGPMHGKHRFYH